MTQGAAGRCQHVNPLEQFCFKHARHYNVPLLDAPSHMAMLTYLMLR
jgi:hypothetical protein